MSTQPFPPFPIDRTLTPATARQRGYVLVCDALPDFVEANRVLIASLLADGCILGVGNTDTHDDAVGIYQPLTRQYSP